MKPFAHIGLRAHSGWAALVVVAGSIKAPAVIDRRRIQLADHGISGSVQPYHAARPMPLENARAFLERCASSSRALARNALHAALNELNAPDCTITGACILLGSGRATNDVAAILASHPAMHTAEGEFFRDALRSACEACGLSVSGVKERELFDRAATALRLPPDAIQRRLAAMGKTLGPPWTQDEKLCALAAWLLLASSTNE